MLDSVIEPNFIKKTNFQHFPSSAFPTVNPVRWLTSHFAVGGWSPLQRLSGMLTAHMTTIAPHNGFTWHPHRGLEIYTWVIEGMLYHEDTTGGNGEIKAGDIQRMFSGQFIQHQELNNYAEPTRVIQIWYVADYKYFDKPPHYQQLTANEIPKQKIGAGNVFTLIGDTSPLEQHMTGRLTATNITVNGKSETEPPRKDEDLFLYVTDGNGEVVSPSGELIPLNQYDVILATPELKDLVINSNSLQELKFMSFYLPTFITK